ncbi:unnamed protein product [Knipowitschia caucasica]|uniref:Discoidin, CUB and LCCL domain containing 2 n=2 Tax=Knipowitschia caucasica TaxID=637954 RepID=A0AAV2K0I1_KNICA
MVGRPTQAGGIVLSILLILSTDSCKAQKGDGCGRSLLGPTSGTLSSLGYPRTYPNNSVCEWEITVPRGNRIHFRFADLDIEDGDCQVNYLRLYNGIGPDRSEMVKLCGMGLTLQELIESSDHQVTVQFMSGMHHRGRGFYLSFSLTDHTDLITCLEKGADFPEAEFSKYCPAGCLTSKEEISGTMPTGYRESSPLCVAAIHAGVVSNALGGKINVVSSKGIPHYEGTLANNVTSTGGTLSNSLFTFRTSGCIGTLGLESGGVADSQLTASSVWEWHGLWAPSGGRLKKKGLPWAPSHSDLQQYLQIDLKRKKIITGIITTGSTMREYQYYVSAYRILYNYNGHWQSYKETNATKDKVFQGNINYLHEVRNNFVPPIEARFLRINPLLWHQRIALRLELFGCQIQTVTAGPRMMSPFNPTPRSKVPPRLGPTTATPDIRNTTVPPHSENGMALIAVLVPVLAMILTGLILTIVCACHCKNRKQNTDGTYDLPHWDRTDWWKSMKQLLPSKMLDSDETVRYSSSEVGRLTGRGAVPILHAEPAEYAQPLVSGVTMLGPRSTFKPDEGLEPGYSDPDLYDAPMSHPYAEPLPASGAEYATPIVVDMSQPPAVCSFMGPSTILTKPETGKLRSPYDTPKNVTGQVTPTEDLTYQVPQNSAQKS